METFSYDAWDRLLAEVVAGDGKVDYERLAVLRALLREFVADLGAVSPDSRPDLSRSFLRWVDQELDPAAEARGVSSCEMCHRHLAELPAPAFAG